MAIGDIQIGKSPANTQVNLPQMRGNLASVLSPGMLGNNVANPMTGVIGAGGDAQMGYMNAIANSRMQNIGLQAKMQALKQAEEQYQQEQQQPGLLDFLGLGLKGVGAIKNRDFENQMNDWMKNNG